MNATAATGLDEVMADLSRLVEAELRRFFEDLPRDGFYDIMRYHLGWKDEALRDVEGHGGKRIRPAICILACEAMGGQRRDALQAALSIELLHNFSLIHDDIEDEDRVRRGRPAVWTIWGIAQAMNAGDGMHALSKLALGRGGRGELPAMTLALSACIDRTSLRLCEGQYCDLTRQRLWDLSAGQYLSMVRNKSGALLGCAAECGSMLAGADEQLRGHYRAFGELTGIAYQIRDDLLAIWGNPAVTGKPSADLSKGKTTLPLIYAWEQASESDRLRLRAALKQPGECAECDVMVVREVLDRAQAREWSIEQARLHSIRALAELEATGVDNRAQERLREIAAFAVHRDA